MKAADFIDGVTKGDRRTLARAITLVESRAPADQAVADEMLMGLIPHAGRSFRLGVSGVPGVGKSSFIEAFGSLLLAQGRKLAILAIDPSSPISGGSIMGDRTRMEKLSSDDRVFIRPSPTSGTLGGVARRTREAIITCEAAGFDFIIVETVGVGQSETAAQALVDAFLLLYLPNAGDELQGIKKGILELADFVAVTKADGATLPAAEVARGQLERAFMVAKGAHGEVAPAVHLISSVDRRGLAELHAALEKFAAAAKVSGDFTARRQSQAETWLEGELVAQFRDRLSAGKLHPDDFKNLLGRVARSSMPASLAASQFLDRLS